VESKKILLDSMSKMAAWQKALQTDTANHQNNRYNDTNLQLWESFSRSEYLRERIFISKLDNVEFKSDMRKSVWRIINPAGGNPSGDTPFSSTITTKSDFYKQIYLFRKGVHILRKVFDRFDDC